MEMKSAVGPPADLRSRIGLTVLEEFRNHVETTIVVDDNFEYKVGLKIAIAACTRQNLKFGEMPKNLELAFEARGCFCSCENVYRIDHYQRGDHSRGTGSYRTYLEPHSGGILVVYDADHPHDGKGIAIHAGYEEELGSNIALKLQGMSFE